MILKNEIREIAEAKGVPATTIDKDWVLGHFVKAIYSVDELCSKLAFKGGTCLHKCYIENYRFSEDLDFTTLEKNFRLNEEILNLLCNTISAQAGIQTHLESFRILEFDNQPTGFEVKIKFWGADHPRNQPPPPPARWTTSIKIEIIQYELIVFETQNRGIIHPYSDKEIIGETKAICYSIEEIITEKLRALIQRSYTAPRDYFDIWYLVSNNENLDWKQIKEAFTRKVEFKKLEYKSSNKLLTEDAEKHLYSHWEGTLRHQLKTDLYVEPKIVIDYCKSLFAEKM